MKGNLLHTIFFAAFLMFLCMVSVLNTHAQDHEQRYSRDYSAPPSPSDSEQNELNSLIEEERIPTRMAPAPYMAKDSMISKSVVAPVQRVRNSTHDHQKNTIEGQKNSDKQKDEKEESDSILSFNFIYYIFQKFKLSDIVDKDK